MYEPEYRYVFAMVNELVANRNKKQLKWQNI